MPKELPSRITFNKDKTTITLSGSPYDHIPIGESIDNSKFVTTLHDSCHLVHTVFLAADQRKISNVVFSRFRKNRNDDSLNLMLPKLQKIVFDPGIKSLPEVDIEQILKYIAMGITLTCSKELTAFIQKQIAQCPGYPSDNTPLSIELAKMLLECARLIKEQKFNFAQKISTIQNQAAQLGSSLYVFTLRAREQPDKVIVKITLFSSTEVQARQILADALTDPKIAPLNHKLFNDELNPDEFNVSVLQGDARDDEYHGRRFGPKDVLYIAENNGKRMATETLNSQYSKNLATSMTKFNSKIEVGKEGASAQMRTYSHQQYLHLVRLCSAYISHLRKSIDDEDLEEDLFSNEEPTLVQKKYRIVSEMLSLLQQDQFTEDARIEQMIEVLSPENRERLSEHREYSFLEKIMRALGFSPQKGSLAFFNAEGKELLNKIDPDSLQKQAKFSGG
ncbi:MAG: hypothetical protein PSV35_03205 [bacterium]|nr:hypothetical protein [bacterium]